MFDARRRLEDPSIGFARSQAHQSRTLRLITNVEMFATARDDGRMLRSNFLISEFWDSETRTLTGWAGHRVVRGRGWKIRSQAGQSARMRSGHPQPEARYPFRRFRNRRPARAALF
jgi:3-phenylpropionate/cinnamic acid dioxygenase small subunit